MPLVDDLSQQGFLSLRDLTLACRVFYVACQRHVADGDPLWDGGLIGQELIAAYRNGVRAEADLMQIAVFSAANARRQLAGSPSTTKRYNAPRYQ